MKKVMIVTIAAVLVFTFIVAANTASAVRPNGPSAYNGLCKSKNTQHLYLYEKDSSWNAVEGGAYGKINVNLNSEIFAFDGFMLSPFTDYTLIHYTDSWPNNHMIASGTTDEFGMVTIIGDWVGYTGKFWLVPTNDLSGIAGDSIIDSLIAWNPTNYLFEYAPLPFDCD